MPNAKGRDNQLQRKTWQKNKVTRLGEISIFYGVGRIFFVEKVAQ